jgi:hypothetical protein
MNDKNNCADLDAMELAYFLNSGRHFNWEINSTCRHKYATDYNEVIDVLVDVGKLKSAP